MGDMVLKLLRTVDVIVVVYSPTWILGRVMTFFRKQTCLTASLG